MSQLICISILFALGYFVGGGRNRMHLRSLDKREAELKRLTATTGICIPGHANLSESTLVHGGVVISVDYFKRVIGLFHTIIGGRVRSYESLMSRGRREAIIRMKESALSQGADAVINVRIETTRMANGRGDKQTAGIEVLAYGTAVRTA